MVESITLRQVGMSVLEYSLKFTKLSKNPISLVSDPRDEMNRFVTGVSDDLQEKCYSDMLHDNMNTSYLMVHVDKWKRQGLRETIYMQRGQDLLTVVLHRVGLISKTILGSMKGLLIKFLQKFLRLGTIWWLALVLRREGILVHQTRSQILHGQHVGNMC